MRRATAGDFESRLGVTSGTQNKDEESNNRIKEEVSKTFMNKNHTIEHY